MKQIIEHTRNAGGLLALTTLLAGCATTVVADAESPTVVTVGVVGAFNAQWDTVNENLQPYGIVVELVHFTDGSLINTALNDGDIDLNAFQNRGFFDQQVESLGLDLAVVGETFVSPMNVFAGGRSEIAADPTRTDLLGLLPPGAIIGIPDNVTNASRALRLLEAAGLIGLDASVGYLVSEADIVDNPLGLVIHPAEATTLVSLLPDFDAAVINAPQALTGGVSPTYDSIFREDAFNLDIAQSLINILAARANEVDNPVFAQIVTAYQQANVAEVFATTFQGAFVPVW